MRSLTRVLALVAGALLTLWTTAGAAVADAPVSEDWPAAPDKSALDILLLFGGGTLGLYVVVVLFGLLTARHNYEPPPPGTDLATTSHDVAPH